MVMTKVARAMVGSVREAVGNCLVELDDVAGVPMQGWRTVICVPIYVNP